MAPSPNRFCDFFSTTSKTRASKTTGCRKAADRTRKRREKFAVVEAELNLLAKLPVTTGNCRSPGDIAMKNSIFVIKPYKWEGLWVFDDANAGLVKEPFVGGADSIIDVATARIPNAHKGFLAGYFPDAQIVLEWVREEGGGNVYRWKEKGMEGWLCPALLKYFEQPPAKLHIQVKAAG